MIGEYLIKQMFGDNAVSGIGKIFIRPRNKIEEPQNVGGQKLHVTFVSGVILTITPICTTPSNQYGGDSEYAFEQMVEGEFVIIPKRIYEDRKGYYSSYRIDQIMTDNWSDPKKYTLLKEIG